MSVWHSRLEGVIIELGSIISIPLVKLLRAWLVDLKRKGLTFFFGIRRLLDASLFLFGFKPIVRLRPCLE